MAANSTVAAGAAIRWALEIVLEAGIRGMTVESDSKIIIDGQNGKGTSDIFGEGLWTLYSAKRESNTVAHSLARCVQYVNAVFVWIEEVPDDINLLVSNDARAYAFRFINQFSFI
ncbi:conserved hypothetical protein [Ricinus communis]|uniref:Uncharacterized protein n=1 Tax=Ricinus communis TaxID=3988 RepID=B9SMS5_RICCO|nr:conserved hypothetical protein [Ricinus communis]